MAGLSASSLSSTQFPLGLLRALLRHPVALSSPAGTPLRGLSISSLLDQRPFLSDARASALASAPSDAHDNANARVPVSLPNVSVFFATGERRKGRDMSAQAVSPAERKKMTNAR